MQPLNLAPSSVLKVFESSDVDEFRSALDSRFIRIVPTQAGPISAMQAVLALPNCEIYLLRTFPRLVDLEIPADRTLVLFSMVGTSDTIINGQQLDYPSLILGRGPTDYRMVEGAPTCVAGIRFDSAMLDRGWPQTERMLVLFRIREPVLIELQFLIRELLVAASSSPSRLSADLARQAAQETVLAALDRAFLDTSLLDLERARSFQKSLHIVNQIEARLSANLGTAIYSDGLASELRISVRTMHSAMLKIRGMSLHRYLRLRRLWAVRRQLLAGGTTLQIKACALSNGFWHLGEFAALYAAQFGEAPSITLARSQQRPT
jgi:AraC-type DNA-binding domain-containing proteins